MYGRLWLVIAVASGFVGLGFGLYVLVNIYHEAVERQAAGKPIPPDAESRDQTVADSESITTTGQVCSNCQTVNDSSFEYCSECATKL